MRLFVTANCVAAVTTAVFVILNDIFIWSYFISAHAVAAIYFNQEREIHITLLDWR
jgi:hypothetical protein